MCTFDVPDCFNCPYPDCTATSHDIQRQWKNKAVKALDNIDYIPECISNQTVQIGITYTDEVKARQERYNHTDKGKARLKKYYESEKGKENERKKMQRRIASGKNAEACRRYYERKKNLTKAMQDREHL